MSLEFFYEENFLPSADLSPVDSFIGDGVNDTFTLVSLTGAELSATVTVEDVQYYQFTGGLSKTDTTFTLSSVPTLNSQIVAPGTIALVIPVYDQDVVDGVSNPRIKEIPFYLGDRTEIHLYNYTNLPSYSGIRISFVDLISGSGADLSWVQLACSSPTDGSALTYAAAGSAIEVAGFYSLGVLTASSAAGASSIMVSTASTFTVGKYIIINPGDPTEEIRKIQSKTSSTLNFFTNLEYSHNSGEDLYDMGVKCWAKITVPSNVANNQAFNFHNLGLRRQYSSTSKV